VKVARVQEVVNPLLRAVKRLGLGELIVVVWELKVAAPGMDVQPLARISTAWTLEKNNVHSWAWTSTPGFGYPRQEGLFKKFYSCLI
jgi:hypothetical protein